MAARAPSQQALRAFVLASLAAGCAPPAGGARADRAVADRDPALRYFCDLPTPRVAGARAPEGFCVRRFATLAAGRVLAFAPDGDVFVSSPQTLTAGNAPPGRGVIAVLADDDRDGVAEVASDFLAGVPDVHGLLFVDGWLYFTLRGGVYRVPRAPGQRRAGASAPELVADLANASALARWTHTLARAADGAVYVSVGMYAANVCPAPPRMGAILRLVPGSTEPALVSTGFRNPMYLRCDPAGTTCYAAELSDDAWDPDTGTRGREKLVVIRAREDYGYPCCAGRDDAAPPGAGATCASVSRELRAWPLHDTPFGIDFERGRFPAPWRGGFFVAQHGAYGTWENAKILWSPVDGDGRPTGRWADFVTGWGRDPGGVGGRPTDLAFAPDGRLFFTDDQGASVYWVAPEGLAMPAR